MHAEGVLWMLVRVRVKFPAPGFETMRLKTMMFLSGVMHGPQEHERKPRYDGWALEVENGWDK